MWSNGPYDLHFTPPFDGADAITIRDVSINLNLHYHMIVRRQSLGNEGKFLTSILKLNNLLSLVQ